MAQTLRTVWLEPEEQQEPITPQLRPRRQTRRAAATRQNPLAAMSIVAVVAVIVGLMTAYISSYARIARYEFQRQELTAQSNRLAEECAQLKLDIARLENTPRITQVAQAERLEIPTADRVHFVPVAVASPQAPMAQAAPATGQGSWFTRAGRQMASSLKVAFYRLGHGQSATAYAHE